MTVAILMHQLEREMISGISNHPLRSIPYYNKGPWDKYAATGIMLAIACPTAAKAYTSETTAQWKESEAKASQSVRLLLLLFGLSFGDFVDLASELLGANQAL